MASASLPSKQQPTQQHPLQRLSSPSRGVSALIHLVGLASFTYSYWYLSYKPNFVNESYGWHWQYLTVLGLTLATATFTVGILADITLSPRLFFLKNSLSVCSCPLEVLVSILYWGIGAIDKKLVAPAHVQVEPFPDFSFHAAPAIFLTIDLLLLSPPWTINVLPALALSLTLAFGYWGIVEHCYSHNGWYPYPLFEILDVYQRIGLFAMSAVTMTASTHMLKYIVGRVNGFETPANIKGE